eukprot:CAMPEP_0116543984 /NCGR_PEP_ID=MMETSP0397-20121206/1866_1 /TAXON_ID=216820 /ORGANISM="Cyclophora tenuis, Strain ECT3854" /LENGTH=250 /DNA_ID=CAMNT_0004068147 /DNA_START=70 /DNA_END=825 /DNA_ORIENTATION=-
MEDGTVWMYHIPTSKCMQVFVGHESGVTAGSFTPDGRSALTASADGTLRVWAPRTGVCKHIFRFGDNGAGLNCLATGGGSDGQLVIVGSENGQAHVCHISSKKVVATLHHYEVPNQAGEEQMDLPTSIEAVGFAASNPNWCATGGADGAIKVWDLANRAQCRQVCRPEAAQDGQEAGATVGITRLRWHDSAPVLVSSMVDGSVQIWDARNGQRVKLLTGHTDVINDLSVCIGESVGRRMVVVTGSDDKMW